MKIPGGNKKPLDCTAAKFCCCCWVSRGRRSSAQQSERLHDKCCIDECEKTCRNSMETPSVSDSLQCPKMRAAVETFQPKNEKNSESEKNISWNLKCWAASSIVGLIARYSVFEGGNLEIVEDKRVKTTDSLIRDGSIDLLHDGGSKRARKWRYKESRLWSRSCEPGDDPQEEKKSQLDFAQLSSSDRFTSNARLSARRKRRERTRRERGTPTKKKHVKLKLKKKS